MERQVSGGEDDRKPPNGLLDNNIKSTIMDCFYNEVPFPNSLFIIVAISFLIITFYILFHTV